MAQPTLAARFPSFLLGLAVLLPYNVVVTAIDFFRVKFGREETRMLEHAFVIAYQLLNVSSLAAVLARRKAPPRSALITGLLAYVLLTLLALYGPALWTTVAAVGLLGLGDAVVSVGAYGAAAARPLATEAVSAGNGASGAVVSALRILTKLVLRQNADGVRTSTVLFACLTVAVLLAAAVVAWRERAPEPPPEEGGLEFQDLTAAAAAEDDEGRPGEDEMAEVAPPPPPPLSTMAVARLVRIQGVQVTLTFWATLACFPGLLAAIPSSSTHMNETGWFTVLLIAAFNFGDLFGRCLPAPFRRHTTIIVSARFLAFPVLIYFCTVLTIDVLAYCVLAMLGITNGGCATVSMATGPTMVPAASRQRAATVMVAFLTAGLTLGVTTGYALSNW